MCPLSNTGLPNGRGALHAGSRKAWDSTVSETHHLVGNQGKWSQMCELRAPSSTKRGSASVSPRTQLTSSDQGRGHLAWGLRSFDRPQRADTGVLAHPLTDLLQPFLRHAGAGSLGAAAYRN